MASIIISAAAALPCLPWFQWKGSLSLLCGSIFIFTSAVILPHLYGILSIWCPHFCYQTGCSAIYFHSPTLSPLPGFDQEWFPAHWFAAFRGVNCVILRILPWHGSRGRGRRGKRDFDKGALPSCEHCFFKSIFSMADGRGHSSGWGGVAFETCAMMLSEEARASHAADCQGFVTLPAHYSLTQSSYQPITLVHV